VDSGGQSQAHERRPLTTWTDSTVAGSAQTPGLSIGVLTEASQLGAGLLHVRPVEWAHDNFRH
jgi:hypothetical protein